ncbi:MAG: CHRD domain-containing protein [Myxococcota bacterium]|nr:CHRD domain-containing protein [Myxococcota bacterium]
MTLLVRALILSVVFLFASGPASGLVISLAASIDGAQANGGAGTGSSATGSASLTFDDQTNELTWSGSYSGLGSDFLVAHFHGPAAPGVNAGVALGISVVGNTSGTFDGSSTLSAGQAADLLAGLWYINIHSTTFTGGEIRGQVLVAPEPALGLVLGVAALAVVRRRRR